MEDGAPLHVLLWLGAFARHGLQGKPLKKASKQAMGDIVELAELGASCAVDWPRTFFRILEASRVECRSSGSLRLLNEALPGLTKKISKVKHAGWQRRITEALGTYAAATQQTSTPLIGRNVRARTSTVLSLAKELGVRSERLLEVVDTLPAKEVIERRTAGGRLRRLISPAAATQVRQALKDEITVKAGASLLELNAVRVRQLAADGQLKLRRGRLSRTAVVAFKQGMTERVVLLPPPVDAITLAHALRHRVSLTRTSPFIQALKSGALTLYASSGQPRIAEHLLSQGQLRGWMAGLAETGGWLTVPDCAKRLGLKQEVVYHLVRVGLLATQTIRAGRRKSQVVSLDALHDFELHIEPLARAASRAGVNPRQGVSWADATEVVLVSGPRIDGGRQYFARRGGRL